MTMDINITNLLLATVLLVTTSLMDITGGRTVPVLQRGSKPVATENPIIEISSEVSSSTRNIENNDITTNNRYQLSTTSYKQGRGGSPVSGSNLMALMSTTLFPLHNIEHVSRNSKNLEPNKKSINTTNTRFTNISSDAVWLDGQQLAQVYDVLHGPHGRELKVTPSTNFSSFSVAYLRKQHNGNLTDNNEFRINITTMNQSGPVLIKHLFAIDRENHRHHLRPNTENTDMKYRENDALGNNITICNKLLKKPSEVTTDISLISISEKSQSHSPQAWNLIKKKINSEQEFVILNITNISKWATLLHYLKEKLNQSEVISIIQNLQTTTIGDSTIKGITLSLSHHLGDSQSWTMDFLEKMGTAISLIHPTEILKIQNLDVKSRALQMMYTSASRRFQTPVICFMDLKSLVNIIVQEMYGSSDTWVSINDTLAQYLPLISPVNLNLLKSQTVKKSLTTLGKLEWRGRAHSQPIITKAISISVNVTSESEIKEARQLFQRLGSLIHTLRVDDIKNLPQSLFQIDVGIQNVLLNSEILDAELGRWILAVLKQNETPWTKLDTDRLSSLLRFASPQMLFHLSSKGFLDRRNIFSMLNHGQLNSRQLQAIKPTVEKLFKHDNKWNITNMPAHLFMIMGYNDIQRLNSEDVTVNMQKFNQVVDRLSELQRMAVATKILEAGLDVVMRSGTSPQVEFITYIPYGKFDSLSKENQQLLLRNMSRGSPQVKEYVEKKWRNGNITLQDLRDDYILASTLTCQTLNRFPVNDTMELLSIIQSTGCGISYNTEKCITEKLKQYILETTTDSQIDDDTEMISNLKVHEIGIIGGEILVHFSAEALQEQHPLSKCRQIFSLIGHLQLTTLNLLQPIEKKKQIARAALNCLDKQEDSLGISEMTVIANLMGYLPEISIDKMDNDAFILNLPYLLGKQKDIQCKGSSCHAEVLSENPPIEPCISTDMRASIRRKLLTVFGLPEKWSETEVRTIGCLLSTLFLDQIRQLKDEALISAADELGSCWNDNALKKNQEISGVYWSLCDKELLGSSVIIQEANTLLMLQLKEATLRRMTNLINARQAKTLNTIQYQSPCEFVQRLGPAIDMMSIHELDILSTDDFKDCLHVLGRFPMSSEKAIFLWEKTKKEFSQTADQFDQATYETMGFIVQGIDLAEVQTLRLDNLDIISIFGTYKNFSLEQLKGFAVQVKSDYQADAGRFSPSDLLSLGYIICGFEPSDIEKISANSYALVSYRLRNALIYCHPMTRVIFAQKAIIVHGATVNWTAAILAAVGPVLGGLPLKDLASIPGSSFEGLHFTSVATLSLESMKILKPEQLGNLSIEAISYLTSDQLNQLSAEQMEVINDLKNLYNKSLIAEINAFLVQMLLVMSILYEVMM